MFDLKVGDIIEGEITDFGMDGEGVMKVDGLTVFVPYAILSEKVRARVTYVKKDFAFADLIEVLNSSEHRIKPFCPYFMRCGGCDLQHIDRSLQTRVKTENLRRSLLKIGKIDTPLGDLLIGAERGYRNKLSMPFGYNARSGRIFLGFYEKKSHRIVPVKWCGLSGDWAADLIAIVTDWANSNSLSVYNEETGKGLLRHISARMLNSLTLTIIINGNSLPKAEALYAEISKKFPDATLYISENTCRGNAIMGNSVKLLFGIETPKDMGGFFANVSPLSFLQVNNEIRDKLYDAVIGELGGFCGEIVELYSGVGLLTAKLALSLPDVRITAVEIVEQAVQNADALMLDLNLTERVENVCCDATEYLKSKVNKSAEVYKGNADNVKPTIEKASVCLKERRVLILDPPRKGCDREVLNAATEAGFGKIIYISCNPATLARDLGILTAKTNETLDNEGGSDLNNGNCHKKTACYEITKVQPFDMFPQTSKLETLVILNKICD